MNEEPEVGADRRQRRPILRVRTGCLICRARKKKCDEAKPTCMGCRRNKLQCEWPTTSKNKKRKSNDCKEQPRRQTRSQPEPPGPASPSSNSPQTSGEQPQDSSNAHRNTDSIRVGASPVETVVSAELSPRTAADVDYDPAEPCQNTQTKGMSQEPGCSTDVSSTSSGSCISGSPPTAEISYETLPFGFPTELLDLDLDFDHVPADIPDDEPIADPAPLALNELALSVGGQNALIPRSMPLFPGEGGQSYELLAHYLSRTALSMGNGSTVVNPFISQLIPLAFANQFILDLVICQSAVHRATENATQQAVAQKYYNSSLRQFRKSIDEYINGQEMSPLWIALGALIMCFTETAKGDVHGVVFDHMEAAGPLVSNLVSRTEALPGGLRSFIVEYYVDVATISMISIDPNFGSAPFLSHQFEELANQMVSDGYIGQLCGCWLELLLLLPQIFEFSKRSGAPTPDDFVTFSGLQSRITSFKPSAAIGADVALSGHIFREATHIYLLTATSVPNAPSGQVKRIVNDSVAKAFSYLEQLSPNSRVNTSLCWALAVIGSCVDDENQQRKLRDRLGLMFLAIGLGNIRATSALLDKLWMLPIHERGPWTICRVMHDHEMWISFV